MSKRQTLVPYTLKLEREMWSQIDRNRLSMVGVLHPQGITKVVSFLGDDEAPLNPTKRLALDGDGNAVFDAAGAVLVALRPLRRGEELLLAAGAPPDARGSPIIDGDRLLLAP